MSDADGMKESVGIEAVNEARQEKPCFIKTRDDMGLVRFLPKEGKYVLDGEGVCSWVANKDDEFDNQKLRERIEPWLTSLFQSEHLNLLLGAGLTTGVCCIAGEQSAKMLKTEFSYKREQIESAARKSAQSMRRNDGNFEDRIRVAIDLLRTLELYDERGAKKLRKEVEEKLSALAMDVLKAELDVLKNENKGKAFNCLVSFLMSFASRVGTRDRLHIFTTNYDRFIEEAADIAGLHLIDRFVGKLEPVFRSSRMNIDLHYNPPGIRGEPRYLEGVARFTKLHGSLDWVKDGDFIRRMGLPFGSASIMPFLEAHGLGKNCVDGLMIFPNSSKDVETSYYPYVELFRDFAAATCRPNTCLVTYGYSFGDEHINRAIRDMLTIPSTHLVIISYDDPLGRILSFYENSANKDQLSLIVGPPVADLQKLTENFLPKAAIDFASQRMGRLIQSRLSSGGMSEKRHENSVSADLSEEVSV